MPANVPRHLVPSEHTRVGTTGAARAGGEGRARLSVNGEWSLKAGRVLPTVTPVTQGTAAREAIAWSTTNWADSGVDPQKEVAWQDCYVVPLSRISSC